MGFFDESFRNELKAKLLVDGLFNSFVGIFTAGATQAVKNTVEKRIADVGGKKTFTDEKWFDFTRRTMDEEKRKVWDREIHPALLKDFGPGFFSRLGYIDAATQIRLNLEAKAQEEIPTIKMEIKNDKGKVVKVVTRPVTTTKPLSAWCLETYVDLFLEITKEHIDNGATEVEAKEKALAELRIIMRDAGFAVGQSPELYQKLDDFVSIVPDLLTKTLDGVKTFAKYSGVVTLWVGAESIKQIQKIPERVSSLQQWIDADDQKINARRPKGFGWLWALIGG